MEMEQAVQPERPPSSTSPVMNVCAKPFQPPSSVQARSSVPDGPWPGAARLLPPPDPNDRAAGRRVQVGRWGSNPSLTHNQ
jgi:hypothetical protein